MADKAPNNDAITDNRIRQIDWILSDVDGVMTDGGVIVGDRGEHSVRFHIHDGLAVKLWRSTGRRFGILSGRSTEAVRHRSSVLQLDAVYLGVDDKRVSFEQFLCAHDLSADTVCYVGDDLPDLPVLRRVGLAIAVANACTEVREAADYVTCTPGGSGAIREVVEVCLRRIGEWEKVLHRFE